MRFSASDIARIASGRVLAGPQDALATSLSWDSRDVSVGCLYVALVGQRVDGHDYCADAARAGASVVLTTHDLPSDELSAVSDAGAAVVSVGDATRALFALAGAWRDTLDACVVAITGSSGKTTTKELSAAVLATAGKTVATRGNRNNELGVPATLLEAGPDTEFVVVEMGMRGAGQLSELCTFAKPTWALVTNVGTSHIELLGSQQAIACAKAEPYTFLEPETGVAFVNASDAFAPDLISFGGLEERDVHIAFFDGSGADVQSFPADRVPAVFASSVAFDDAGNPHFVLNTPSSSASCSLALAGAHNVHNALAAAALGFQAGLDAERIAHALEACQPASGRQALRRTSTGALVVDDSYNANPDSMRASLAAFRAMATQGRRIAVLGDMYELGSFTEEGHASVGRDAAASSLDLLVCVGGLAEQIASAARDAGMDAGRVVCVADATDALAQLESTLAPGDAVLVKASHSVGLDAVVEGLAS